jgi:Cu-Zn family superoxide dismutase
MRLVTSRRALAAALLTSLSSLAHAASDTERLTAPIGPTASPAGMASPGPTVSPESKAEAEGDDDSATATLVDQSGKRVGLVTFTATPGGTVVNGEFTDLPAGVHAFHIHTVGKCEPPFDSAGGHFDPTGEKHGVAVGKGHAGDLPNLFVPASGKVHIEHFAPGVSIGSGPNSVFDTDGAAVIVHADRDDYKTDPTGNAGGRIACGVIER